MSAKGYVVRGKRGSDGAEIAAWTHDGGIGSPVSAARFRTPGQACGAADALTYRGCTDVTIFAVAEDGTETPLPSYEEALAKIESLTDESAAGWAIAQARLKIMEEQAAAIARLRAEIARIPGLEQANREAHQAIAGLKAKTARINKAWARLVKAAQADMANLGTAADDATEENTEAHAQANAAYWAAVQALRALGVDVDALLRGAQR